MLWVPFVLLGAVCLVGGFAIEDEKVAKRWLFFGIAALIVAFLISPLVTLPKFLTF